MGKPGKKKNAGVGVDFKRVKHKVGKKLPRAANQTDTTIKSRAISLPEQSVGVDKGTAAVTHRNLTLKELLGQCGHYSEKVRKDAVQGLAELAAAHTEEVRRHATLVMEAAAERITDGDKAVRAALREALAAAVLPALGGAALSPFVPLLMAHVGSAMTHLADPIRADALGFLELLTDWRADLVASSSLAPALQHYADLLSKGSRGRSIKAGSLASLAAIVSSLERFLSRTVGGGSRSSSSSRSGGGEGRAAGSSSEQQRQAARAAAETPAHGAAGSRGSSRGKSEPPPQQQAAAAVLQWRRCLWPPADGMGAAQAEAAAKGNSTSAPALGNSTAAGSGGTSSRSSSSDAEAAARAVLGHLVQCWGESGASQLVESPDQATAHCLASILRCLELLLAGWGLQALGGSPQAKGSLSAALLSKIAPHFPVHRPAAPLPAGTVEQLVQVNVAAAQLLCRFLPSSAAPAAGARGQQQQQQLVGQPAGQAEFTAPVAQGQEEQGWVGRLLGWFADVMQQGSALPAAADGLTGGASATAELSQAAGAGKQRGAGLPAAVYQSALSGTAQVLPLVTPQQRRQLLAAVLALWERSPLKSQPRALVLAFWRQLLASPASSFYQPLAPSGEPLILQEEAAAWLAALPKFIYQLGSSSSSGSSNSSSAEETVESALRLLLDAARFAPPNTPLAAALDALQPQLAPLFCALLPPAGNQQRYRLHVGPLARMSPRVQELAVDCLFHMPSLSEATLKTAALLCLGDAYPTPTALRLLETAAQRAGAAPQPAAVLRLLLCALSGSSQADVEQQQQQQQEEDEEEKAGQRWQRHEAVVGAACRAALQLGDAAAVAAALGPPLLQLCEAAGAAGVRACYGLLSLSLCLATATCTPAAAVAAQPASLAGAHSSAAPAALLAAQAQQADLPAELLAQLPRLMLQFAADCEAVPQGSSSLPSTEHAASLAAKLVSALPGVLPGLLGSVAASLQPQGGSSGGEAAADTQLTALAAALPLLVEISQAEALQLLLLAQEQQLQLVLESCEQVLAALNVAAGGMRAAGCKQQLLQLRAACSAACGWQ